MQKPIDIVIDNVIIDEKYEERKRLLKQAIHVLNNRIIELKRLPDNIEECNATVKQLDKLKRELEELEIESNKKK